MYSYIKKSLKYVIAQKLPQKITLSTKSLELPPWGPKPLERS